MLVFVKTYDGFHKLAIAQSFSNQKGMNWFSWSSLEGKILLTNSSSIWKRLPHQRRNCKSTQILLGAPNLVEVHIWPRHRQKPSRPSQPTHQLRSAMSPLVLRRGADIPTHFSGVSAPALGLTIPTRHMVLLLHLAKGDCKEKAKAQVASPGSTKKSAAAKNAKARLSPQRQCLKQ